MLYQAELRSLPFKNYENTAPANNCNTKNRTFYGAGASV